MPAFYRLPLLALLPGHELHPQQPPRHDQIRMRHAGPPPLRVPAEESQPAVAHSLHKPVQEPERALDLGPLRGPLRGRADLLHRHAEHLLARAPEVRLRDGVEERELAREEEGRDRSHYVRVESVLERGLFPKIRQFSTSVRQEGGKGDARGRRGSPWA